MAAFAVDPKYRGAGRGDALLAWVEAQAAERLGARSLFLLTTRTADWFQARGFAPAGRAAGNAALPPGRAVDSARGSLLFVKTLGEPTATPPAGRGSVVGYGAGAPQAGGAAGERLYGAH